MASGAPWTENEVALAADYSFSARAVGEIIGRTQKAVKSMRRQLRAGTYGQSEPPENRWTEEEEDLLRELVHLSSRQIAVRLGRTPRAVTNRRWRLGIDVGGAGFRWATDPTCIAQRRLVARTCSDCGELLASRFFRQIVWRGTSKWETRCNSCRNNASARPKPQPEVRRVNDAASTARLQALSLPYATRHGEVYTEADDQVLANPRLTVLEKAVRTQRTYYAAQNRAKAHGWPSRKGHDRDSGRWVITPPEEVFA